MKIFLAVTGLSVALLTGIIWYYTQNPFVTGVSFAIAVIASAGIYAHQQGWIDTKWMRRDAPVDPSESFLRELRTIANRTKSFADKYEDPDQIAAALRMVMHGKVQQHYKEVTELLTTLQTSYQKLEKSHRISISVSSGKIGFLDGLEKPPTEPTRIYVESPPRSSSPPPPANPPSSTYTQTYPTAASTILYEANIIYEVVDPKTREKCSATGAQLNQAIANGKKPGVDFVVLGVITTGF